MLAIFVVCSAVTVALQVVNGSFQRDPGLNLALWLAFTAFMVVGAVIVAHRPGNAIGWLFSAAGLLSVTGSLALRRGCGRCRDRGNGRSECSAADPDAVGYGLSGRQPDRAWRGPGPAG